MKSVVYTKYVKDFDGLQDFELHMCKHSDGRYDVYASIKNSANKYHVVGGYVQDLNEWLEGRNWWEVFKDYMDENDIFTEVLEQESALEGLAEINFMRRADNNYFSDLMLAFQKIQRGDYSPALKDTLKVIIDYFF